MPKELSGELVGVASRYIKIRFAHKDSKEQKRLRAKLIHQLKSSPGRQARFQADAEAFLERNAEAITNARKKGVTRKFPSKNEINELVLQSHLQAKAQQESHERNGRAH